MFNEFTPTSSTILNQWVINIKALSSDSLLLSNLQVVYTPFASNIYIHRYNVVENEETLKMLRTTREIQTNDS